MRRSSTSSPSSSRAPVESSTCTWTTNKSGTRRKPAASPSTRRCSASYETPSQNRGRRNGLDHRRASCAAPAPTSSGLAAQVGPDAPGSFERLHDSGGPIKTANGRRIRSRVTADQRKGAPAGPLVRHGRPPLIGSTKTPSNHDPVLHTTPIPLHATIGHFRLVPLSVGDLSRRDIQVPPARRASPQPRYGYARPPSATRRSRVP